jgi:hypothetical protein
MSYCCPPSRIAKKKITQLSPATEAALDDLFETVQYDPISGEYSNKKQTLQLLVDLLSTIFVTVEGTGGVGLDGEVDPEGVVTANKNVWYRNNADDTYWWKTVDGGNTGWHQAV